MAVQAQYPQNVLVPDFRARTRQMFAGENRTFLPQAATYAHASYIDDFQQLQSASAAAAAVASANQLRLFAPLGVPNHGQQATINTPIFPEADNGLVCNLLGAATRKRQREADDLLANSRQQQHLMTVPDFHQNHGSGSSAGGIPQTNAVSTGLRLTFEEDRLNSASSPSTSGRAGDCTASFLSAVGEDALAQQKEEIDLFFKAQGEQLRQLLEEKRVRHSRTLMAAIEEGVSRRMREKDLEVEAAKRRGLELEERVKQAALEAQIWQNRYKSSEATVLTLRSNLQQAVALSREQSKEGCGDSEADDAASSHHDDSADAHARTFRENKELKEQRACRVCRCNDASILLLPCRHLCLCKDCEARQGSCPICNIPKNGSVQVYMK